MTIDPLGSNGHWASATAWRQALLARHVSSTELLAATLARIERLNPALNAVIALEAQAAADAARQSDDRIAHGTARPLEGLVMTVKDAFDVAGLPAVVGSPAYRERVADMDASAVARLRAAGAIILGKTNVPPFCGDFQTVNPVNGATRNPWDATRGPGGSSGGAAAALASGLTTLELGSDLGGSIRWPAHACGVFGLKTTFGLVSTYGHVPPPVNRRTPHPPDLMVAGPLARCAADLDLMLEVLAGPRDPRRPATPLRPPRLTQPKGLRVGLWPRDPFAPVCEHVSETVERAGALLADAGARVETLLHAPVPFAEIFEVAALLNHAVIAYGLPPSLRLKLQRLASGAVPGDLDHRSLQARGARMTPGFYQLVKQRQMRLQRRWAQVFQRFDVILCPPAPVLAIPDDTTPDIHARRLDIDGTPRPWLDFLLWSAPATGAGLPAACAPIRRVPVPGTLAGLPAGVQILAGHGEDRTAIAVAGMLEMLGGGFVSPPG
jgi:amidase